MRDSKLVICALFMFATETVLSGNDQSESRNGDTTVYRHGQSTAVITQQGNGPIHRDVQRDGDTQFIRQSRGNNSSVTIIQQSSGAGRSAAVHQRSWPLTALDKDLAPVDTPAGNPNTSRDARSGDVRSADRAVMHHEIRSRNLEAVRSLQRKIWDTGSK